MPIKILNNINDISLSQSKLEAVTLLCDDIWELPVQLFEFERWLECEGKYLSKGSYIADIGFSPRSDAGGGGGCLSVSSMQILTAIGIEIWFSEYPN